MYLLNLLLLLSKSKRYWIYQKVFHFLSQFKFEKIKPQSYRLRCTIHNRFPANCISYLFMLLLFCRKGSQQNRLFQLVGIFFTLLLRFCLCRCVHANVQYTLTLNSLFGLSIKRVIYDSSKAFKQCQFKLICWSSY